MVITCYGYSLIIARLLLLLCFTITRISTISPTLCRFVVKSRNTWPARHLVGELLEGFTIRKWCIYLYNYILKIRVCIYIYIYIEGGTPWGSEFSLNMMIKHFLRFYHPQILSMNPFWNWWSWLQPLRSSVRRYRRLHPCPRTRSFGLAFRRPSGPCTCHWVQKCRGEIYWNMN